MEKPTVRTTAELARDADALVEELGAGLEVVGVVEGRWTEAGAGAVLRPGSITKVVTATAVLQAIDDGLLGLDDPVSRWVPHIDGDVLVRHLLSHSSGIDAGDVFVDTGDGD